MVVRNWAWKFAIERNHFRARTVQVKCGYKTERTDMRAVNLPTAGIGLVRRNASQTLPFVMAARKSNRPLPAISLRVPVTPANRNYLRQLRNDEMRAWQNNDLNRRHASTLDVASSPQREQRDLYVFGVIVALTLALVVVLLAQSPGASQRLAHWVSAVRHVLS